MTGNLLKKAPAVLHQRQQHVECLRSERNDCLVVQQKAFFRIEVERTKFVEMLCWPVHKLFQNFMRLL